MSLNRTKKEWVLNPDGTPGYTWNPITGCLNGCEYCYARRLANTRLKERYLANGNYAPMTVGDIDNPFYPRFWRERFRDFGYPNAYGVQKIFRPKGIFVCDMSDLFGIGIPQDWTRLVLEYIRDYPEHHFYLLTKQPQNLPQWSPFPDNCYVGVTATDDSMFRIASSELVNVEAKVKYIAFEPLLDWNTHHTVLRTDLKAAGINWLILGAQTKPTVYPKIEWIQEIVEACDRAGIRVFLKDNLFPLISRIGNCSPEFTRIIENAEDSHSVLLRQELPDAK